MKHLVQIIFLVMLALLAACGSRSGSTVEIIPSVPQLEPSSVVLEPITLVPLTPASPVETPSSLPTATLDPGIDDPPYYYGGLVMTMDNVGGTLVMKRRGSFLLSLGESYDWTVSVSPPDVLTKNPNITPEPGVQGVYVARRVGRATLSAVGEPTCARDTPPCLRPSVLFTMNIVVE